MAARGGGRSRRRCWRGPVAGAPSAPDRYAMSPSMPAPKRRAVFGLLVALPLGCGLAAYLMANRNAAANLIRWLGLGSPPTLSAPTVIEFGNLETGQIGKRSLTIANMG